MERKKNMMADMFRGMLGKSVIIGGAAIAAKATGVLLTPVRTRFLTTDDYGVLGTVTAVSNLLVVFVALGCALPITLSYRDNRDKPEVFWKVFGTILSMSLALALVILVAIILFGDVAWQFMGLAGGHDPYPILWCVGVDVIVLGAFCAHGLTFLLASERAGDYAINSLVGTIGGAVVSIGLIVWGFGLNGHFFGMSLGGIVGGGVMLLTLQRRGWRGLSYNRTDSAEALQIGLPMIPHFLAAWGMMMASRLILVRYTSLSEVGFYTLAVSIGSVAIFAINALNQAWSPRAFRFLKDDEDARSLIEGYFSYWLVFAGAITVIAAACSPVAIAVLATREFQRAEVFLPYVFLTAFANGVYHFGVLPLFHLRRTKCIPVVSGSAALITVFLTWALVPHWGGLAAAAGLLVGFSYMAVFFHVIGRNMDNFGYRWKRMAAFLVPLFGGVISIEAYGGDAVMRYLCYGILLVAVVAYGLLFLLPGRREMVVRALTC